MYCFEMVILARVLISKLPQANVHGKPNIGPRIEVNETMVTQVNFSTEIIWYKSTFLECGFSSLINWLRWIVVEYENLEVLHSPAGLSPKISFFKVTFIIHIFIAYYINECSPEKQNQ